MAVSVDSVSVCIVAEYVLGAVECFFIVTFRNGEPPVGRIAGNADL